MLKVKGKLTISRTTLTWAPDDVTTAQAIRAQVNSLKGDRRQQCSACIHNWVVSCTQLTAGMLHRNENYHWSLCALQICTFLRIFGVLLVNGDCTTDTGQTYLICILCIHCM